MTVRRKAYRLTIVLFLFLSTIFSHFAKAEATPNAIDPIKEFVIGVEAVNYYPLYDFSTNNTSKPSFTKELLITFFESKNYQYKLLPLPIKRFSKWIHDENIDFKFPDNIKWHAAKFNEPKIIYSQSVIELLAGSYVLKKNKDNPRDNIKKLGTILGFYPFLWVDKLKSNQLELIEDLSSYSLVKHLIHGNIDATNININVINHNLKSLKREGDVVLNRSIPHKIYSYHLSSMKHPNVIKEFDYFIANNPLLLSQLKNKYNIKEPIK